MQLPVMGEIVAIRELIALLGQPLQLVMIRAVVMVAVDVEVTVFLVKLDLIQVLDTGQQIVGAVDELATLRHPARDRTICRKSRSKESSPP